MDKIVMDAINKGWALGIGTRVRGVDADLEAARERAGMRRTTQADEVSRWLPALILVSARLMH
jgi:hypothetical protein